jgi:hypothetical protein
MAAPWAKCGNGAPLSVRSASVWRLDSFACFSYQEEKYGPDGQGSYETIPGKGIDKPLLQGKNRIAFLRSTGTKKGGFNTRLLLFTIHLLGYFFLVAVSFVSFLADSFS